MIFEECYHKIKEQHPYDVISDALDFGSFYVFFFIPLVSVGKAVYSGTIFDAIEKKSGKVFRYDITSNPDAYIEAKKIDVETILDQKMEGVK